ncbi:hypothetical protein [Pedobacter jamesrossensis]|uniref:DUF4377 domain-containing protein n=1 Tax=Pedobacter jamesrossensis TaxID=1908238 RepID=A0ABV8NUF9_9SPHI
MRYLPILFLMLLSFGCSKEAVNPKNGQIVELFVDHYEETGNQRIYLLPKNEKITTYLEGFSERELGYTYKVSAKAYYPKEPPQDGPDNWFIFEKVLSKTLSNNAELFTISLKYNSLFGSNIAFAYRNQVFEYGNYVLRPENDAVKKQLEDLLLLIPKFQTDYQYAANVIINATVIHDPSNRAKGYLVKSVTVK